MRCLLVPTFLNPVELKRAARGVILSYKVGFVDLLCASEIILVTHLYKFINFSEDRLEVPYIVGILGI